MKKYIALPIVVLMFWSCATNPLTGRQSLALVSNAELFPQAFAQYDEVLDQSQVDNTSADAKMIKNVGQRIKYAAEKFYAENGHGSALQGYEWEFNLIKNEQLNAWCMPGGKVAFYTGILPVCKNETGVAVVMGHEVSHALAGHSAEQVSNAMVAQGIMVGGNMAISNEQWNGIFNQLYPMGAQLGMLKYGRSMELDADEAGLYLMAMAGYNPQEATAFWERMQQASSGQQTPPEFLSTHPSPGNRIAQIQAIMPKAMEYYNASPYKGK
ncbi:M48 family metallopeptidase [Moheibacter lacus]|uniref:M48 family metallopeptidase n=1 Tax=Moheibacter lacus TaxID=2745851 RepID=A0A838ZPT6_9FLAO|nr:M48 family metallopeptidase [Moheibacter lacus]MBA5629567.1 M48 family metallopeptidase [Moheibacter lacus]